MQGSHPLFLPQGFGTGGNVRDQEIEKVERVIQGFRFIGMRKRDQGGDPPVAFERAMIRERTRAGLKAAAAKGRKGGRKPALNDDQKADIADNVLSGRKTGAEMARLYKVSQATITRTVAEVRLKQEIKSA